MTVEEQAEWFPKTLVGKKVKNKEILAIEEIFETGKPILEYQIVDTLLPGLESETLEVGMTQRMTDCGRKSQYRAIVLVGDKAGHVGIGSGKSEEVKPAIESAIKNAKLNIMTVPMGCGSWECGCKSPHSLPIKLVGKNGSVEVTLKPAPKGLGVAANKIVKKVLTIAGVRDVWSFSRGKTANIYNSSMAVIDALSKLSSMKYRGDWKQNAS
ncbi:30S ribosomal protein S5 [Candidatus Parvarchaeota archaeon]|nr:30S ribosomal protein S5 [Candidatus Parvarchaeota archaeon]